MRIKIKAYLDQEVKLPYSLNYPVSSYFYQMITLADRELGDWLHQEGLRYHGRTYKPIVFSEVFFEHRVHLPSFMKVKGKVWIYVDSIQERIIKCLVEGIWKTGFLQLKDVQMLIQDIEVVPKPVFVHCMKYETLSPLVVPIQRNQKLHYCHPLESQFYDQLRRSIRNWYYLKWKEELAQEEAIHIRLLQPEQFQMRKASVLHTYKQKKIKGYHLSLEIEAPPKVQQVFYEAGAGSLSSQGWGMLQERRSE